MSEMPRNLIVQNADIQIENGDLLISTPPPGPSFISVKDTITELVEKINKLQEQVQALETAITYLQLKVKEPK
jgi:sensor histidine kinase YesM